MKIEITGTYPELDSQFVQFLTHKLKLMLMASINDSKLIPWNGYLNNLDEYKSTVLLGKLDCKKILIQGINNIVSKFSGDTLILEINPHILLTGLNQVSLEQTCRLINYGNVDMKGYPIFTDMFTYFSENIVEYVNEYYGLGGI